MNIHLRHLTGTCFHSTIGWWGVPWAAAKANEGEQTRLYDAFAGDVPVGWIGRE